MNCSAKNLADTANAPIGIFADRDYYGRTFYCGEKAQFNITVSNFSQSDIEQAKLVCSLESDTVYFEKVFKNISSKMGEISNKANLEFVMPLFDNAKELSLNMRLVEKNRVLAQNRLQLWCYPNERIYNDTIIYHVHCSALEDNIEANINGATSIWNWISILLGCVIPEYGFIPTDEKIMDYLENSLKKRKPSLIICDKIDHISKFLSENGVPVLYIDSGNFSEELYPEKIPDHSFFDLGTFYTPFRAGWDEGNCATVLCGELFNEPKNDGFADLRYYASIQGSRGLFREKIIHILGLNNIKNTFHLIQKVKNRQLIQENASVYFERMQSKKINDLVYYVDGKVKETNTAVCSLNLFEDPCGKTLFNRIIKNLLIKEREDNE